MNKLINKFLAQLEFYVGFELDEAFEETIKSRFRDVFKYENFSQGEKMRIDLALLFTWRAVARMKNSVNTNLLILDEVFDSSLDASGTDEFMKMLNTLTEKTNAFIISHKGDILYDKFEHVIRFEKYKKTFRELLNNINSIMKSFQEYTQSGSNLIFSREPLVEEKDIEKLIKGYKPEVGGKSVKTYLIRYERPSQVASDFEKIKKVLDKEGIGYSMDTSKSSKGTIVIPDDKITHKIYFKLSKTYLSNRCRVGVYHSNRCE